jgi:hypothetical protein
MGEKMTGTQTTSAFSQRLSLVSNVYTPTFGGHRVLITEPDYDWWPVIMDQLKDLVSLEAGWDGYQGEPVSFENAAFALKVLETICFEGTPAPQIVPGTSGDLQIEWHTHVAEIELHILAPNNVYAWVSSDETGEEGEEFALTVDFSRVAGLIRSITEYSRDQIAAA